VSALLDDPRSVDGGAVLLLGSGVIASAVAASLKQRGHTRIKPVAIPWESNKRTRALRDAMSELPLIPGARNALIWAAGRAGFSADEQSCNNELLAFKDTVDAVAMIAAEPGGTPISLHLVSSAGGLFEGLARVSVDSPVTPRRPYGYLKQRQEEMALQMADRIPVSIYRVSSVYGCPRPGQRVGLVGELLRNGLDRRPSAIYGAMDTLRDYVGSSEVGRHIAGGVLDLDGSASGVEMVVSGRPTAIGAVIEIVQRLLRRRLLVSFEDAWNARDITFDPAIRARGFGAEDLRVGISRSLFELLTGR
jgi:UDP-glucose 4-epimerase